MRSPFVTGLVHPFNLAMLAAAVFAGLLAAWWLFLVGLVLWLVMVVAVARNPSLRITHRMHSREPLASRFQTYFRRVERCQLNAFNSLAAAPRQTRRAMQPVQVEVDNLTAQVYALCHRMTSLENYRLVSESTSSFQADLERINDALSRSGDALVRQQYEESRRTLLERVARLKLVTADLDQVEAQLLRVANQMDSIVTKVIRLQTVGAEEAARRAPHLVQLLREHTHDLARFEQEAIEV